MAIHVINEAERCLQCKKPMCQEGCPIHTPIPQMIKYFKEERLEEAGCAVYSTQDYGALSVWSDGTRVKIDGFLGK